MQHYVSAHGLTRQRPWATPPPRLHTVPQINNAGVGLVAPLVEGDLKEARRLFDANYFGLLDVTQQVVPHMAQRGSGTILNVGSVTGAPFTCGGNVT